MSSRLVNRNITADRGRTSMRLEPELWAALHEICAREQVTLGELVRKVERLGHPGGRTSAIRVHIVQYFRSAATEDGHHAADHGASPPRVKPQSGPSTRHETSACNGRFRRRPGVKLRPPPFDDLAVGGVGVTASSMQPLRACRRHSLCLARTHIGRLQGDSRHLLQQFAQMRAALHAADSLVGRLAGSRPDRSARQVGRTMRHRQGRRRTAPARSTASQPTRWSNLDIDGHAQTMPCSVLAGSDRVHGRRCSKL